MVFGIEKCMRRAKQQQSKDGTLARKYRKPTTPSVTRHGQSQKVTVTLSANFPITICFHVIPAGIHPGTDKIAPIREAPRPTTLKQLLSFLGVVNYLSIFLPGLADKAEHLWALTWKGAAFQWTQSQSAPSRHLRIPSPLTCNLPSMIRGTNICRSGRRRRWPRSTALPNSERSRSTRSVRIARSTTPKELFCDKLKGGSWLCEGHGAQGEVPPRMSLYSTHGSWHFTVLIGTTLYKMQVREI